MLALAWMFAIGRLFGLPCGNASPCGPGCWLPPAAAIMAFGLAVGWGPRVLPFARAKGELCGRVRLVWRR